MEEQGDREVVRGENEEPEVEGHMSREQTREVVRGEDDDSSDDFEAHMSRERAQE